MEANQHKPTSLLVMSLSIALVGSVIFDIYKNRIEYDRDLENTELNATVDSLSMVKERLSKDVETAARNLQKKADKMEQIIEKYNDIRTTIQDKTVLLHEFKSKNAELRSWGRDKQQQINLLNEQIAGLNTIKEKLEKEISSVPPLEQQLVVYKYTHDSLNTLSLEKEQEISKLSAELEDLSKYLTADLFRVEVLNHRDNITTKARKGKRLHVTMIIPEHLKKYMKDKDRENIYVTILDGNMQPVKGSVAEIPFSDEGMRKQFPVKYHATQSTDFTGNPLEIEFIIPLYERLNPGIYVAKFHTTQQYLGSVGFTLRNSFLFF